MNEALKKLFEGMELSEEFKTQVQEAFDTAVDEKTQVKVAQLEEDIEQKYEKLSKDYADYVIGESEEKMDEYLKSEVMPVVEKYLDYSTTEFMKENKLSVDSGIKVQLAESFLSGMSSVAESFNVKVPEGKEDYITEMEEKLDEAQKHLDNILDEKTALETEIKDGKAQKILDEATKDLTESQKEKFQKVAGKVKFNSEDQYNTSISELYESYFPSVSDDDNIPENQLDENKKPDAPGSNDWVGSLLSKI